MSNTSYKKFVRNFYFPNPDWSNVPEGFPNCETDGLTKEEKCLFEAIKLAWLTGTQNGRKKLANRFAKSSSLLIISLIGLISLISLITLSSQNQFTKPVSAATISATLKQAVKIDVDIENLIESTMSAIRKAD